LGKKSFIIIDILFYLQQNKSGTNPPGATIEELRARQEQELYELLMKHRKQLEEEEKKQIDTQLLSVNQHDPKY